MALSYDEALTRAMNICSKSEKSVSDIEVSLIRWGIDSASHRSKIVSILIREKFIDELRFTKAYVRDKHVFNKWGRVKIKNMLRSKRIDEGTIHLALENLEEDKYYDVLISELEKKRKSIKASNLFDLRGKLMRFGAGKGYEADLIFKAIDEIIDAENNS